MAINFESALGLHAQALDVRVERTKILAANIANAETPGYQARDIDFKSELAAFESGMDVSRNYDMMFRIPAQLAADGNTVEIGQEQARFAQNSMDFETSLTFLNMKISGLRSAIKGE
ncbi:flagellar basal body rod protein FlgB [Ferrimonas lipolytica]|uniref:Flagellar basal body rod protein FlgB n=1 Tax=Ferrimonas lipolytica TaxID=2724191 RepID=A0A6H1UDW7_9GAMM|nr:flagellar basal body rod protein FlgB [Ferrimonas lipolytica]QIZ76790.1 flagellar basal body rod protein FlgB [Ferrimonas lipolytica]